jgi:hypothetical protein
MFKTSNQGELLSNQEPLAPSFSPLLLITFLHQGVVLLLGASKLLQGGLTYKKKSFLTKNP